jgi:hypothetical protein
VITGGRHHYGGPLLLPIGERDLGEVMSKRATHGKRRAEPPRKRRRREKPPGGKRADRPESHEGITPEFLEQMRALETAPPSAAPRTGPDIRELLASIDADLRADRRYQQALARLAHGTGRPDASTTG